MANPVARTVETVFRIEQARLIAGLARMTRDLTRAEDLAQDALVAALQDWPARGIPDNPGAWLMAVARRRALDGLRHDRMRSARHAQIDALQDEAGAQDAADLILARDTDMGDELLALIFAACHPVLTPDARAALTLRLIGGLTTDQIARAFLTSEAAISQRIVRAKRSLGHAGLRFEVPQGNDRKARLASVLEVLYLIFNEGYAATSGDALTRPDLCAEALRLGRILAALMPAEPEVWGHLALMELQASRLAARTGPDGAAIALPEQNRILWDRLLIGRGLAALARAEALGGADGPYVLQAALAACHARARRSEDTDWTAIAGLYDRLAAALPSPVVALNRAVAHSMAHGAAAGLTLLAEVEATGALQFYAPLPAARGDMLWRLGQSDAATTAFRHAANLSQNTRERDFLLARAAACQADPGRASRPPSA